MQCPDCQKDLVEIPTREGSQLDVCPGRHGVWLDVGEANLVVQDYRALTATTHNNGATAISQTAVCPRCGGSLVPSPVRETPLLSWPFLSRLVASSR